MNWEKEARSSLIRREQLLEEAEQFHLAQMANVNDAQTIGMAAAAMVKMGHTLVNIGERLIHLSGQPSRNPVKTRYNADNSLAL